MAKTIMEADIKTRARRIKLAAGIHWRAIDDQVHLGFRSRGGGAGHWLVRWYVGEQKYKQATLGSASVVEADGHDDFDPAIQKARQHVAKVRSEASRQASGPVVTVRAAVEAYIIARDKREAKRRGRAGASSAGRLTRYVLRDTVLAETPMSKLTAKMLSDWRAGLSEMQIRSLKTKPDREYWLEATAIDRLCNDFRAALNSVVTDTAGRSIITQGLRAQARQDEADDGHRAPVARSDQFLTADKIDALIIAATARDEDFGRLVLVLARTGARFAQVRRMLVRDVKADRLMIPPSFKGRPGAGSKPHVAFPVGRDVLEALAPVVAGRSPDAPLLERWRKRQVSGQTWERGDRGPWVTASEMTRTWEQCRELVELPEGTIPYALRHSSIVRALGRGLPIRMVAALHNTSITMIEQHYAAHITDSMFDMARDAMVTT